MRNIRTSTIQLGAFVHPRARTCALHAVLLMLLRFDLVTSACRYSCPFLVSTFLPFRLLAAYSFCPSPSLPSLPWAISLLE